MSKPKKVIVKKVAISFRLTLMLLFFASLLLLFFAISIPKQITSSSKLIHLKTTPTPTPQIIIPTHSGKSIRLPILTYHYIGNNPNPGVDLARDNLSVTPVDFEAQMEFLAKNGYQTSSLDTAYQALIGKITMPEKSVILTFDDAYIDFYVNAYPILKRLNLSATVFVPTGLVDQGYYMSWDQIKEIDKEGLIYFQAHSVFHPTLTTSTLEQLKGEITTSKRVLEQQLGKNVNWFAYPYGISSPSVWEEVKKAGFIGAVGTWNSNIISEGVIFNIPRIKIPGGMSLESFKNSL